MTAHDQRQIIRSNEPVETTVGTEIVLMSLASGECFGLGDTGSEVWRQLATPVTLTQLLHTLRQQYQAPEGVLEQDVLELLTDLESRNLISLT